MKLTRRALLGSGVASLLIPRTLHASGVTPGRKFVFVFCPGGWDPAMVFAPLFVDGIDRFPADQAGQVGDLAFTDSETRPAVRAFLETWGSRTCFVNGVMVPSVAHDVCTRWAMTGESRATRDDWVSIIAGHADPGLLLPNVHLSGPIFPNQYTDASVRIGANGQLAGLLSGEALASSAESVSRMHPDVATLQETLLERRLDRWTAGRTDPMAADVAAREALARRRSAGLVDHLDTLTGDTDDLETALGIAAGCLESGLSRSAIVAYGVGGNGIWDTHSNNDFQDPLFEELFAALDALVVRLDGSPGAEGGTLLDETVIVVLSEMGRTPRQNSAGGKDHWTWTSAMLVGSGLRGGRSVGAWTDELTGEDVDLASGEVADDGVTLLPGHLGATLLALADIDPAEWMDPAEGEPITALLEP